MRYLPINAFFTITSFQEAAYSYPQTDYTQVKQEREYQEIFMFFFQTSAYGNVNYDPAYNNYYDYSLVFQESNQEIDQQQNKNEETTHSFLTPYSPLCP